MFDYVAPADLLKDKVILITGAGDGIGKAAALSYASHGATVILSGRTLEKLEAVYDAIEEAGYPQAAIIPLDLEKAGEQEYLGVHDSIMAEFGRLDGLLHNAGLLGQRRPIESYPADLWQKLLHVNVTAMFLLTKALLPLLKLSDSASIICTSSGVGQRGRAYWGAYAVSKFATEGFMQVLAQELGETSAIRVNCINPGATNTAMRRAAYPAEHPDTNPKPEEIMPVYLYLMGKDSADINGQSLYAQQG
jgi:NAD(P)-dependent dehydrogenase (short-subunit alcohol dehydrogenase family)